jgi:hypothetical protein
VAHNYCYKPSGIHNRLEGERNEILARITLLFSSALLSNIYHCHVESMLNEVLRIWNKAADWLCVLETHRQQTSTPFDDLYRSCFPTHFQTMQQRVIRRKCGGRALKGLLTMRTVEYKRHQGMRVGRRDVKQLHASVANW